MSGEREQGMDTAPATDELIDDTARTDVAVDADVVVDADEESPENLNGKTWVSLIVFAAFVVFASGCMTGLWWG